MAGLPQLDERSMGTSEQAPPHLQCSDDNALNLVAPSQWLCRRCRDLKLQSHVERPWTVIALVSTKGHYLATIEDKSINDRCSLCSQFVPFLDHPALLPHLGLDRSFDLWCRHVGRLSWTTTQLFIPCHNANEDISLYPINASVFRSRESGEMLPLITPSQTDRGRHLGARTAFARVTGHKSPDFDTVKKWMSWCRNRHEDSFHTSCASWGHAEAGKGRLVDCLERRLCADQGQLYVCLSYVWGEDTTEDPTVKLGFPNGIPQTVEDAMLVTLRIGLRYLWVDRYAIDQGDGNEKHRIIRNMGNICESSAKNLLRSTLLIMK
jgi:hypothetical protein